MSGDGTGPPGVDDERVAVNVRRARVVLPVMIAIHVAWAGLFALVAPASAGEAAWRGNVIALHAVSALLIAAVWALVVRGRGRAADAVRGVLGEVMTAYALGLGTVATLNTLHHNFALTAWIMSVMLASAAVYARFTFALIAHAAAALAVAVASYQSTDEPSGRLRLLSNVTIMGGVAFVLSRLLYRGFVREVASRRAIESMNLELERRVAAQVGEIVAHADRIDGLNRQLAAQVQSRSLELSAALQRLAAVQHGEDTLRPGALLAERFEIAHVLGVGGMGVVYAAFDRISRAAVAVKLVHGNLVGVDAAYRFLQEASATASLSHPAVVRVLHVDVTDDGRLFQVQELVEGRTLDAWTDLDRALPPPIVARLGAVLADGLAAAHALDIVHRDVKPQNVMLTPRPPGCRLLDFGLAKLRRSLVSAELTEAGTVIGTPQFLSPEQIATPAEVGGPSDVYALGMVLYLCAAARFPFDAIAPLEWLHAHGHVAPRPLEADGLPAALGALIMRCLAKDPAARPPARTLADELGALAAQLGGDTLEHWAAYEDRGETRQLVQPRPAGPATLRTSG